MNINDRKNYFNFDTIKMFHLRSNVHLGIFKTFYINGLNRMEKLISNFVVITWVMANLYDMAISQGYLIVLLNDLPNSFTKNKEY